MVIDKSNYKKYMSSDTIMNCSHRNITEIRYLPDSLERLYCDNNQLTTLPELPDSLIRLYCDNNQLTSLPELPDSLGRLYCNHNCLPIDGRFYDKEEINEVKIRLDNIIKLEKFLLP